MSAICDRAAGFFSLLTFSWMNNVLKLGSKQPLEEKDLFPIKASNQAEKLVVDLEREWLEEERVSEQNRTKPRLWKAMMRVISFRNYITVGLLRIFFSTTLHVLPVILWFFLRSISIASEINYTTTFLFVLGISLITIARSLGVNQAMFQVETIAIRLKVATMGLVYKKASIYT